jgi:hypothetical protein
MISELVKHIKDVHSISVKEGNLLYKLAKQSDGAIVEIGSWKGYSTIWLAKGSLAGNKNKVYAIDPHTGAAIHKQMYGTVDTFGDFIKNIKDLEVDSIVTPLRMTSENAVKEWKDINISLLWIDGDHMLPDKDLEMWFPYVKYGGVIALHDTTTWEVPNRVAMGMYKSEYFTDIKRVGSITYAKKVHWITVQSSFNNVRALFNRKIYQALLPSYNLIMTIGAKILGRA